MQLQEQGRAGQAREEALEARLAQEIEAREGAERELQKLRDEEDDRKAQVDNTHTHTHASTKFIGTDLKL